MEVKDVDASDALKEELRLDSPEGEPLEEAPRLLPLLKEAPLPGTPRKFSHQWIFLMAFGLHEMATPWERKDDVTE